MSRERQERPGTPEGGADRAPAGMGPAVAPTLVVAPLAAEIAGVAAAASHLSRRHRAPQESGANPASPAGGTAAENGDASRSVSPRSLQWPRGASWRSGWLGGQPVVLGTTGDGAAAAAAGLAALIAAARPARVLVLGVAGGLTPGLPSGALVAARQVLGGDGSDGGEGAATPLPPTPPGPRWLEQAVACGATAGTVLSTPAILSNPAAKAAAYRQAGTAVARAAVAGAAAAEPVVADLESLAYARVAAAHALPWLVVRAVLDPAEEALPFDFERFRTAGGGVSNVRVLLAALAMPWVLPALWQLRARMAGAAARLAAIAGPLVAAAEPAAARRSDPLEELVKTAGHRLPAAGRRTA